MYPDPYEIDQAYVKPDPNEGMPSLVIGGKVIPPWPDRNASPARDDDQSWETITPPDVGVVDDAADGCGVIEPPEGFDEEVFQ
jgi:hypothetical protein